jgi:hypothetical protein
MDYKKFTEHIKDCIYLKPKMDCPLCGKQNIKVDDFHSHIYDECPKAEINCPKCGIKYKTTSHHDCVQDLLDLLQKVEQKKLRNCNISSFRWFSKRFSKKPERTVKLETFAKG